MTTRTLLLRVTVAAALAVVALAAVFRLIDRPVRGATDSYSALFTDANGLRIGDDVRLHGVPVGKVTGIDLDGVLARVEFTVLRDRPLYAGSTLAVRFQNLTGFRYLDLDQPDVPGERRTPGSQFGTADTVPAFDITTLFKGLQPVLAQLSPEEINRFTTSMLALIDGDGAGLGPALDAVDTLSRYASDRQAVLSTLVRNLAQIGDRLGGKSGQAVQLLTNLTALFTAIAEKLPGLVDFAVAIPPVLQPIRHMLQVAGITGDEGADLDAVLRNAFPDPRVAVAVFGRLPGLIQSMAAAVPATGGEQTGACSSGTATAPEPLQVLIAGQGVTLCHAR
ncbi:MlaD family protein [Nocardia asteroides]|uniref:Mce family protein n=1 Tax=Nocardia asteroides NBRC 15531 TaxID=1110697 RepID=U5ELN3_NOCAS|nr:MlaD family protein [Nocardia asteroides]UGT51293.1 MlaD family protein [Nocardia asteroides]GAD86014.1 Mce family protein [Nocardia asteroides NBRC 15531]SFM30200.1 phospholipid/cholesterol/gamma-HCH transport system substrate-binding protein [Nocardia asteroides]VEG35822.1 virulence factor Mce family protein [Nocardia asteroides]